MTEAIPGYIREAGQEAAKASGVAGDTAAGQYTVGDLLTKKITEAYGYNKDIISKLDANTQAYFSAPSEARVKYQDIWNPFQRENLVSQYTGNKALPMLSEANVLGARMGGISDLVGSAVGGYQAKVAREQSQANSAQQNYENLLQQYQLEQQLNAKNTQEVTVGGRKYLLTYDKNGNVTNKVDLGPSGTGGSGGAFDMAALAKMFPGLFGTENLGGQSIDATKYWDDVITYADLNESQKREALARSANSNKSIDEIAREIVEGQGSGSKPASGGTYDSTGTPAANLDYSGLQYTGFKL